MDPWDHGGQNPTHFWGFNNFKKRGGGGVKRHMHACKYAAFKHLTVIPLSEILDSPCKDIANATGWCHIGVDAKPNLNLPIIIKYTLGGTEVNYTHCRNHHGLNPKGKQYNIMILVVCNRILERGSPGNC